MKEWTKTGHDLDFVFSRDGAAYGVEVKNTLGYMDYDEFSIKIAMCKYLGIRPVLFVARMLPKSWIYELTLEGGFALVLKYQLYPPALRRLAERVKEELELPIGWPRRLEEGTMARFMRWHEGVVNSERNSRAT